MPEGYCSHLVCESVDLSVNLSVNLSVDLSTSNLNDHLVLNLEWKYQIKVGDILGGN